MSGLSTYLANAVLNWIRSTAMPSDPAAVYAALFNGDPTDAGSGGSEVTTTIAAARVAITFGAPSGKIIANSADVDFGTALGGATVDYVAIFDAATTGNMLGSSALVTPRTILTGDPVKFAIGDLTFDLTTP